MWKSVFLTGSLALTLKLSERLNQVIKSSSVLYGFQMAGLLPSKAITAAEMFPSFENKRKQCMLTRSPHTEIVACLKGT